MKAGSKKISCIGIVGDGCGGDREFIVQDGVLSAYDAKNISKKACIISIECENEMIEFDLSML